jgi:hypothetical protein
VPHRTTASGWISILIVPLALWGCREKTLVDPESAIDGEARPEAIAPEPLELEDDEEHALVADTKIRVELPPPPRFPSADIPTRYPDQAWSIRGLREDIDARVREGDEGVEVVVRAWVQEVYRAPECLPKQACPRAKQAHLWVVDDPRERGKKRAMLIVNHRFTIPSWEAERWRGQPEVELEEGRQYRFKGRFRQFTDTGFAYDRGLLQFVAVEHVDARGQASWIYPPGAPWHPLVAGAPE